MEAISLYELNSMVHDTLQQTFRTPLWVRAELSDVRCDSRGHCYMNMVEKAPHSAEPIAQARGVIWAGVFRVLRPYFENATQQLFTSGIKVLVQVTVEFHERYGYSLTVCDIDPSYTLGDIARQRKEILDRLRSEGVIDLNKVCTLPPLPQRIAVISSATAAGYGDFYNQLIHNPYGYVFYPKLFPAIMQGREVERSIIAALDKIAQEWDEWDAVVIIRGGGATTDLTGFDTYLLAAHCAQFPLPLITGIGHERDDTVIDVVAHTRVKTPTAAAEFLIARIHETADWWEAQQRFIEQKVIIHLSQEKLRMERIAAQLPGIVTLRHLKAQQTIAERFSTISQRCTDKLSAQHIRLERLTTHLHSTATTTRHNGAQTLKQLFSAVEQCCTQRMEQQRHRLEVISTLLTQADPQLILKRGYSITLFKGKAVRPSTQLCKGDVVITKFQSGILKSKVINYEETDLQTGSTTLGRDSERD